MTFIKSLPLKASQSILLPQSQRQAKYNTPIERTYILPLCGTVKSYHLGCRCELCKKAEREYRKGLKKNACES